MSDAERQPDPTLARMAWSEEAFNEYAEAAERLCHCEGLCVCHWDDPESLAMKGIERRVREQMPKDRSHAD